jgi:hypothetical protein
MHPVLRIAADRQLGVFTAQDAHRAGYAWPEIRRLCTSGQWVRLQRGVYVTREDMASAEAGSGRHRLDCVATLLRLGRPSAALSHTTAARLWGVPVRRALQGVVRLTDPVQWRRGQDFLMTCAALPDDDVTVSGPLRLTTPVRTLVDCAREWPLEDAVIAMDAALLAERTTAAALAAAARSVRGWRGGARAARAVSLADGRAESPLETRGRLRLVGSGLPTPELQVEIRAGGRRVGVVDAWFDEAAVAVEFDGRVKYTDPWRGRSPEQALWEEKRREDELRALDIRFVRVVDADLGAPWPRTEARLRHLLATPGPAVRCFTARPRERGVRRTA